MTEKNRLHSSMLNMYFRCGEQFRQRYILGVKTMPGFALHIGTTVHKVQERELVHKCTHDGKLIEEEEALDVCRDALEKNIEKEGLSLDPEDIAIGKKKAVGIAVDTAVGLTKVYHKALAPIIDPIDENHVEMPWIVEWDGFSFDLSGTMDVVTHEGIRDLKTAAKTPSQFDVDTCDQLSIYSLAHRSLFGELPKTISYDALLKHKEPKADTKITVRTEDDINRFTNRLLAFEDAYKKGVFMPAAAGWACTPKFCGYYNTCKYALKPKTFKVG